MRKTTTTLSKVKVNGRRMWLVKWPKRGKGRNRKFFKSTSRKLAKDEAHTSAKTFFEAKLIEQRNYGTAGTSFTEKQRAEYLECAELLKPHGKTLRDAVAFYMPYLEATDRTCTPKELKAELLRVAEADGLSKRYRSDIRSRFGRFADDFDGKTIAEISTSPTDVDDWLRSLSAKRTSKLLAPAGRNNFRRILIVAFNFAIGRGYCVSNPALSSAEATEKKLAAGVLSVQEAADLLAQSDALIVPAVALGLFAGLRPEAEGLHLDWSHIDFADGTINVEPDKTKVDSSARYVEMSNNLVAWLLPHRRSRGSVFLKPTAYYDLLREARERARIEKWPHDALRHSFGSYHYGAHQDAARTQAQMGHTHPRIFFKHYRKPMKQAAALPYWQIVPLSSSNIIDMQAATG
ncbi:MAG: tyrosine-type recombinase/integrase [Chthoniobacterales bacterium]|nr:tyrosine-type recombinase/integrase [Chthoniobacterales bacterium]